MMIYLKRYFFFVYEILIYRYLVLYKFFASFEVWYNIICEIFWFCYRFRFVVVNVYVGGFCDFWVSGMFFYFILGGCLFIRFGLWGIFLGVSGCFCSKFIGFFVGLSGSFFIDLVIVWRIGIGSVWWFICFWGFFIFRFKRF